jgi:hypothetical protein
MPLPEVKVLELTEIREHMTKDATTLRAKLVPPDRPHRKLVISTLMRVIAYVSVLIPEAEVLEDCQRLQSICHFLTPVSDAVATVQGSHTFHRILLGPNMKH